MTFAYFNVREIILFGEYGSVIFYVMKSLLWRGNRLLILFRALPGYSDCHLGGPCERTMEQYRKGTLKILD